MSGFKEIEGDTALIVERGVFRQVPLYERNGVLFAKAKGGFVRLSENGSTSHDAVSFTELLYEGDLYRDPFGRLCVTPGERRKAIAARSGVLALGAPE